MSDDDEARVARIYARTAELSTFPALRGLLASTYAGTEDIYTQRLMFAHLKALHDRDPDEMAWRRSKTKAGPMTIEEARVVVAEALLVIERGGSKYA